MLSQNKGHLSTSIATILAIKMVTERYLALKGLYLLSRMVVHR